jgi:Fe-S cluster biogenesis protein NfuA
LSTSDGATSDAPDLRAVGERIEVLLEATAVHGAMARERAEELIRLVTDLYGAGLERVLEILHTSGRLDQGLLAELADDDLVASLLLVHGLHPYDLGTRVQRALSAVRPSLRDQGVDVELMGVDGEGVVQLRLGGQVSGCSTGPLVSRLEEAVEAAAPDAGGVRVQVDADSAGPSLIPVSALRSRLTQAL